MKSLLITLLLLTLCLPACAEAPAPEPAPDLCAAAYLGYAEDIGACLRAPETAEMLARYPFLSRIPALDAVTLPGCEVYCILPYEGVTIAVEALDTGSDLYPAVFSEVWRGTGPVLIIGNESDIMPNMQVRIFAEGTEILFTPCISLRDGSFSAHDPLDRVLDFTLYPEGFPFED